MMLAGHFLASYYGGMPLRTSKNSLRGQLLSLRSSLSANQASLTKPVSMPLATVFRVPNLFRLHSFLHAVPKMPPSAPPAIPPITVPQIRQVPTPPIDPRITPMRPPITPPAGPGMRCKK